MPAGCQEPATGFEVGIFSPTPWPFGRKVGLNLNLITSGQWFNQSCLCNKPSIKIQKRWDSESFHVVKHIRIQGEWHDWRSMEASCPFSYTLPHASLSSGCFEVMSFSQFNSVQSLSRVRLFATPWTAACLVSLSRNWISALTRSWISLFCNKLPEGSPLKAVTHQAHEEPSSLFLVSHTKKRTNVSPKAISLSSKIPRMEPLWDLFHG